jgi:transposase
LYTGRVCEEARLAPSLFHRWQEQLFVNAALALEGKRPERSQDQLHVEKLEQKIRQKDEILVELMAEHMALKKEFGEL